MSRFTTLVLLLLGSVGLLFGLEWRQQNLSRFQNEAQTILQVTKEVGRLKNFEHRLLKLEIEQDILRKEIDDFDQSDERWLPRSRVMRPSSG